eukprot:CAMPEP_0119399266 /NCGR_PEP_ID=MMETSP1334-20130426/141272_1 /TAXON_ID=127549 /ORGANISM="Calcidiscus leptoporus, Strain RCC1130" /LENGTH=165 /DNA_ID=CAMNT_0007423153 /DNA_START=1187 /DNA_END=1685 /DNA_ORIENTATION=-
MQAASHRGGSGPVPPDVVQGSSAQASLICCIAAHGHWPSKALFLPLASGRVPLLSPPQHWHPAAAADEQPSRASLLSAARGALHITPGRCLLRFLMLRRFDKAAQHTPAMLPQRTHRSVHSSGTHLSVRQHGDGLFGFEARWKDVVPVSRKSKRALWPVGSEFSH